MVAYSFKRQFVEPIRRGLASPYPDCGLHPKRQTIRAHRERHARPGEELQLYCGMRTKDCFLIGGARCTSVAGIRIDIMGRGRISVFDSIPSTVPDLDAFAQADGFPGWSDMRAFWQVNHPGIDHFEGVLIKWEPLS